MHKISDHGPLLLLVAEVHGVGDVNLGGSMAIPCLLELSNLLPVFSIKCQYFCPSTVTIMPACNKHYSNDTTTPPHLPRRMIELSILTVATPYSVLGRGLIVVQAVAPVVIFSVDERGVQLASPRPPATISTCKNMAIHMVTIV